MGLLGLTEVVSTRRVFNTHVDMIPPEALQPSRSAVAIFLRLSLALIGDGRLRRRVPRGSCRPRSPRPLCAVAITVLAKCHRVPPQPARCRRNQRRRERLQLNPIIAAAVVLSVLFGVLMLLIFIGSRCGRQAAAGSHGLPRNWRLLWRGDL